MRLPCSWAEVTIRKFLEYHSIITKFSKIDPLDLEVKVIACFGDCSEKQVENITAQKLMEAARALKFLSVLPSEKKIPVKLKVAEHTFKAAILFNEMKAVQFRDFNTVCKGSMNDSIYQMHNLIATMLSKYTPGLFISGGRMGWGRYEYEGYEDTATHLFNHLTMDKAYPYYLFFCETIKNLHPAMQSYSNVKSKQLTKMLRRELKRKKASQNIGDGSSSGIASAITISQNGIT